MARILFRQVRGRSKAPNWDEIAKEVLKTLEKEVVPKLKSYGERVTNPWDTQVTWRTRRVVTKGGVGVYVWPDPEYPWRWVSRGTGIYGEGSGKKIVITPKRPGYPLKFPAHYAPHTTVRGPGYKGPGISSGPFIRAMKVEVKGTRPRHFEEAFERWATMSKWWPRVIENAMRRGARRA